VASHKVEVERPRFKCKNKTLPQVEATLVNIGSQRTQPGTAVKMGATKANAYFFDELANLSALVLIGRAKLPEQLRINFNL
jgi:hypothetical protein